MQPTNSPRLIKVEATDLLEVFHHAIDFPAEWDFVILHGPNGVGKTKLLELVAASVSLNYQALAQTPFGTLSLIFDNGASLTVRRKTSDDSPPSVTVSLKKKHRNIEHELPIDARRATQQWLTENTPWMPIDNDIWRDSTDGEIAHIEELEQRYGRLHSTRPRRRSQSTPQAPEELQDFCNDVSIHLIETQRLLAIDYESRSRRLGYRAPPSQPAWRRTVTEYSDHLRGELGKALAQNSRISQQLDRSFPKRIMESDATVRDTDESVRETHQTQNELRSRLSQFNLIAAADNVPLPERSLEPFEVKALSIYLEDTDQKLATFEPLLEKLELFVSIANQRLTRKKISVDVEEGLTISRGDTGERIGAESLSSGEQHELVLLYDLLFRTPSGSTVLIDEPEISLHIAWQEAFISDISQIAELSQLRFIVATHSPQIIDKWWDRTVALSID